MITISIEEMQSGLLTYLREVEAGQTLVITRAGQPVAEVKPIPAPTPPPGEPGNGAKQLRPFGLAKGEFEVPADFDDPLPEDLLRLFEGKKE